MTATLQHPRYRFERYLAAGGMGEVWVAQDTLLDREVAVKLLKRELADDPVLRSRFSAEARHAAALQHPHVAAVLDYGELLVDGGSPLPFLVMELVDGRPLSALLADGAALAPDVAADLVAQVADGVAAAHRLGIVHRDVKPANLLVTAEGQVKVTDFGVARAVDAAPLTMTGQVVGTPHYLSPEQAQGMPATAASDIYALGIVLYECLTGRRPFVADNPVATALMHLRDPLPPFPDAVPARLQQVTRTATAKDPADRYLSMAAFAAALRDQTPETRPLAVAAAPAGAPAAGGRDGLNRRGASAPAARGLDELDRREVGRREVGRRVAIPRALVLGLLALCLVIGGVVAFAALTDDAARQDQGGGASATTSADDGKVRVRADDYLGLQVEDATRRLRALHLVVRTRVRPNPGSEAVGTVAAIGPTGLLEPGSTVGLSAWGPAPVPPATPSGGSSGPDEGGPGSSQGKDKGHGENASGGPHGKPGKSKDPKGEGGKSKDKHHDKGGGKK